MCQTLGPFVLVLVSAATGAAAVLVGSGEQNRGGSEPGPHGPQTRTKHEEKFLHLCRIRVLLRPGSDPSLS